MAAYRSLPQPSAPVCVFAGLRVPPAWRAACVAAAGLAASCARPSLAGAAEGGACGETTARGGTCKGALFFLYSPAGASPQSVIGSDPPTASAGGQTLW